MLINLKFVQIGVYAAVAVFVIYVIIAARCLFESGCA